MSEYNSEVVANIVYYCVEKDPSLATVFSEAIRKGALAAADRLSTQKLHQSIGFQLLLDKALAAKCKYDAREFSLIERALASCTSAGTQWHKEVKAKLTKLQPKEKNV